MTEFVWESYNTPDCVMCNLCMPSPWWVPITYSEYFRSPTWAKSDKGWHNGTHSPAATLTTLPAPGNGGGMNRSYSSPVTTSIKQYTRTTYFSSLLTNSIKQYTSKKHFHQFWLPLSNITSSDFWLTLSSTRYKTLPSLLYICASDLNKIYRHPSAMICRTWINIRHRRSHQPADQGGHGPAPGGQWEGQRGQPGSCQDPGWLDLPNIVPYTLNVPRTPVIFRHSGTISQKNNRRIGGSGRCKLFF